MVTLNLNGVFTSVVIEDTPTKHTFTRNCNDTREITNSGSTGRVRDEVVLARTDTTRCTSVHDERRSRNGRIGSEGRIQENRKCVKAGAVCSDVDGDRLLLGRSKTENSIKLLSEQEVHACVC